MLGGFHSREMTLIDLELGDITGNINIKNHTFGLFFSTWTGTWLDCANVMKPVSILDVGSDLQKNP